MIRAYLPSRLNMPPRDRESGRAAKIRLLYRERCSVDEIRAALGVDYREVSRSVRCTTTPKSSVLSNPNPNRK